MDVPGSIVDLDPAEAVAVGWETIVGDAPSSSRDVDNTIAVRLMLRLGDPGRDKILMASSSVLKIL